MEDPELGPELGTPQGEDVELEVQGLVPDLHFTAGTSYLSFLNFIFFLCKIGMISTT